MKSKLFLLIIALFTLNIFAQDLFEGVVKYKMVNDGEEMFMNYFTNGTDIRIEIEGEESAVMIMSDDKMTMVMPAQKMYMEFPASMLEMAKNMAPPSEESEDIGFDVSAYEQYRTGEKKSIHGYDCEKWKFEDDEGISEMWLTDELGNFNFMQNPLQAGGSFLIDKFDGSSFFPIMMVVKDKSDNELSRFEATEVKEMSIDNSSFKAPAGYQKMDMSGMMNMFKEK
jgi:hypothetical protein